MALKRPTPRSATLLLMSFATCGCVNVDFKEPVSEFSSTMALSNAVILDYYTQVNSFEREQYLQTLAVDRSKRVGEYDESGQPTGLIAQFSPESIKARLEAIALLQAYASKLAALAGADAPERFNTGAQTLSTNIIALRASFIELTDPKAKDPTAMKYVEPIGTIIGVIGDMYLDKKRDAAITDAVTQATPAVNAILDALEKDINSVVEPLRKTGAEQSLTGFMVDYNRRRTCADEKGTPIQDCVRMSEGERREALKHIGSLAAAYEIAIANEPTDVVDGIRDAHAAIVTYATSKREVTDLASLVAALELFNNRVRPVAESLAKARSSAS